MKIQFEAVILKKVWLLVSFCAFLFLFFLCFIKFTSDNQNLADIVYNFLQAPLASQILENGGRMIYTALHEGFFTQVKVAFFISICVSLPIFLIQVWRFVAPGLYKNEKKAFLPFLLATPVLFIAGAAMVYYIVTPMAWNFFVSFEMLGDSDTLPIELEPRISEYLSLMMRLIFAFGLAFELPVILLLLARAGLVTHQGLAEKRKIAIVVSFVAAAILTPPDVISQLLLAIPIIVLYEMSILGARWISPPEDNEFNNS